ncbi:MAG: peptide chain release factor 1, partial [Clostridia bacterium]|nr:peptide chain release factor 1 [Clostridia bacterium]
GKEALARLEEELTILLLPKDPNDDKNVVVEIRACAGGDEAALFAGVLYRMYSMYADTRRYKTEVVSMNETGLGGYREITFMVSGEGAYSRLKYESGVHRVQRVPETETAGRIHTSTASVAVLPEAEDVEIEINPADLEIETIKSSGAGGQHVNKTESAIRMIHKPTGIVIECQDERSQYKNKDKALKLLKTKLYDMKLQEQNDKIASQRRSQVGTGDRSERIRTYNYPQSRITDHRIGHTIHSLEAFLNGEIDDMIDALATAETAERLRSSGSEQ